MLIRKKIFKHLLKLLTVLVILQSCSRNDEPAYEHFVSNSLVYNYSETYISTLLSFAAQSYPEIADLQDHMSGGVNVYKMVYTTTVEGSIIKASGLVSIPEDPGIYPVLSFQNGTNTLNSNCPSEDPGNYLYQLVEFIASMGFIVVVPDYPGFGSSADIPHPYLISGPTIGSVTDMYRAVNEAADKFPGIQPENEYYLIGYSQGGWATMAVHKYLELTASDEFHLAGTVCGAGPYDLNRIFTGIFAAESYPVPAYLGYILNAYTYYDYITNPVSDLLNEPYASRLETLYDGAHSSDQINDQLSASMVELLTEDFRLNYMGSKFSSVLNSLNVNSIEPYITEVPLLFVHGNADTTVPVTSTESFFAEMIQAGTSPAICSSSIIPGLGHGDAIVPCMIQGLEFLIDIRDN